MVGGGLRLVDTSQLQNFSDELALKVRTLNRVEMLREAIDTEEVVTEFLRHLPRRLVLAGESMC